MRWQLSFKISSKCSDFETDFEKAEMVRSMPGLGDKKKQSDLMDASLAVCPSGQQMSPLFINEFLRRIPGDI